MDLEEAFLSEAVGRVLAVAHPDRIILFGAAVADQIAQQSDIGLLVVEPQPGDTRERSVKIRRALGNVSFPINVIVMATGRFEQTKNMIGGVAYPANKYGRVVYAAP